MIYGFYQSATGVLANSHRLDVISNNLANSESVGFKKNTCPFQERLTQAQQNPGDASWSNPLLEGLGGGMLLGPTAIDHGQGNLAPSDNKLDLGIQGDGYFAVDDHGTTRLTRDGRFDMDRDGNLVSADGSGRRVLDVNLKPISLDSTKLTSTIVDQAGLIAQGGQPAAKVGLFAADDSLLTPHGSCLFDDSDLQQLTPATGQVRGGFTEQANVDPVSEMTEMMDAERQLEANANMMRMQDQTLQTLTQQVGKLP